MTKRFPFEQFITKLSKSQRVKLDSDLEEVIENEIKHLFYNIPEDSLDYDNYLTLPNGFGKPSMCLCIKAAYFRLNDDPNNITRVVDEVIVFGSSTEMVLHMTISEYENKFDPNPVLFN